MQGVVFSIEEFSVYDGPGIRTTVFLKGCPLRCSWCHNPEGQRQEIEIIKSPNGCIGCQACIRTAKEENGKLRFTQESIAACPKNLLRLCGERMESTRLVQKLLKNQNILNNGGGVTFSGGEPLAQKEFLFDCLRQLKGELHTAIQTSGYCTEETFEEALALADYFLYDLKLTDDVLHQQYTGVSNEKILRNFARLVQSGKGFTARVPLIPGVTDTEENLTGIARMLRENQVNYLEVLPYNRMAGGKYKMLGREYTPGFDETAEVRTGEEIFKSLGIQVKVL